VESAHQQEPLNPGHSPHVLDLSSVHAINAPAKRASKASANSSAVVFDFAPPTRWNLFKKAAEKYWLIFYEKIPLPLAAAVFAMAIGLIPVLRNAFFPVGNSIPPLNFFTIALQDLGSTVTPMITISLGSKLAHGPKSKKSQLTSKMIFLICWLKLVVVPLLMGCGAIFFLGAYWSHWITDRTMLFVIMMESACPSALLLMIMCSTNNFLGDELSVILFFNYLMSVITITLAAFLFLILVAL